MSTSLPTTADFERLRRENGDLIAQRSPLSVLAAICASDYTALITSDPQAYRRATLEELIIEAASHCTYSTVLTNAADAIRSYPPISET